jgi:hypothetical protein
MSAEPQTENPGEWVAARMQGQTAELRREVDHCIGVMLETLADIDRGELSRGRLGSLLAHLREVDRAASNHKMTLALSTSDILKELCERKEGAS